MDKLRVWSVLLLSMLIAGTSSLAMAGSGNSGPGGSGKSGGSGGYSGHGGSGGYSGHGGYYGHSRYSRPGGYYRYGGHDHWGVSIVVDPFLFAPWPYPSPYYYPPYPYSYPYPYPPAVVTVPASPPVYIERGESAEPAPRASASWYYCADPQGYYPYVQQCHGDWQAVAPRPPGEGR